VRAEKHACGKLLVAARLIDTVAAVMRSLLLRRVALVLSALAFSGLPTSGQITTTPKQGLRENDPRIHALTNARIVTAPGKVIDKGTVVIRDGLISEVGADVKLPPEARLWDLTGQTVYPGFVNSYSRIGLPETLQPEAPKRDPDPDNPEAKPKEVPREPTKGTHAWNPHVTPERNAAAFLKPDKKGARQLRELGFTSALVVPGRGILRGSSSLVNLADSATNTTILAPNVAQHIAFEINRRDDGNYPASLMGCIALIRQSYLDGAWYQAAQDAYRKSPATTERLEENASLAALAEHLQRQATCRLRSGGRTRSHPGAPDRGGVQVEAAAPRERLRIPRAQRVEQNTRDPAARFPESAGDRETGRRCRVHAGRAAALGSRAE
jgi:hypothetical protein